MSMRELRESYPEDYQSAALQAIRERHAALRQALQERARGAPRTASKTVLKTVTRARGRRGAAASALGDGLETPAGAVSAPRRSTRTASKAAKPEESTRPVEEPRSSRKRSATTMHHESTSGPLGPRQTRTHRGAPGGLAALAEEGDEEAAEENDENAGDGVEDELAALNSRSTRASKRRAVAPAGLSFGGKPLATPLPFQGQAETVPVTFVRCAKPGSRLGAQIGDGDAVVVRTRDGTQYAAALQGDSLENIPEKHKEEVRQGILSIFEKMSGLAMGLLHRGKKETKPTRGRAKR